MDGIRGGRIALDSRWHRFLWFGMAALLLGAAPRACATPASAPPDSLLWLATYTPRSLEREYTMVAGERRLLDPFRDLSPAERARTRRPRYLPTDPAASWADSAQALGLLPVRAEAPMARVYFVADIVAVHNLDADFYLSCFSAEFRANDRFLAKRGIPPLSLTNVCLIDLDPLSTLAGQLPEGGITALCNHPTPISGQGGAGDDRHRLAPGLRIVAMMDLEDPLDTGYPLLRSAFSLGVPGTTGATATLDSTLCRFYRAAADSVAAGMTARLRRSSGSPPAEAEAGPMARARLAYQQGEWTLAELLCGEQLRLQPADAEAYFYLGLVYSNAQRYPEAKGAFEHAMLLDPSRSKLAQGNTEANFARLFNDAVEDLDRGRDAEALTALEACVDLHPTRGEGHFRAARSLTLIATSPASIDPLRKAQLLERALQFLDQLESLQAAPAILEQAGELREQIQAARPEPGR
jgi:hypothetical protein